MINWKPEKNISSPWDVDVWENNIGQPVKEPPDTIEIYGVKYKRVEDTQPFYDKLWGLLKTKLGDTVDCDEMADRVMDLVREHIPEPKKGPGLPEYSLTLYDLIADWWDEISMNGNPSGQNIESLVEQIKEWLPKPQSAAGSQNSYVECSVEGFNDCLTEIKGKLR